MKYLFAFVCLILWNLSTAQTYKVMTYNIRYDNPADGVNHWPKRSDKVFALIKKYNPTLLGLQEALKHQIEDIIGAIPQYKYIGVGRDDGKEKGEYSPILYSPSKVELQNWGTEWLSEQPNTPGSKSWDAAITRVVTWALFRDNTTGKEFYYLNTHFDHMGKEARKNSAGLIVDLTKKLKNKNDVPVFVTGDFNAQPTEPPYAVMMESRLFIDARQDSKEGTFSTFNVSSPPGNLIDYIFHTIDIKSSGYQVIKDHDGTHYPSDHLPVMVELTLGK